MTDTNSKSELKETIETEFNRIAGIEVVPIYNIPTAVAHVMEAVKVWHHQQLEAKVAEALDLVLKKAPRDMRVPDEKTYLTGHHRVIGINVANSDWRGAITLVRAQLTPNTKENQTNE